MKKFIKEFKEFISRGNVVDLAVGVVIGSAFTKIVTSLVNDMIMPIIGALFGGIDFTSLRWVIREAVEAEGIAEASINYGNFIQVIVDFLLISFTIFVVIRLMNVFRRKKEEIEAEPEKPAEPTEEVLLLREIRDSLKKD
jgi:large conductance mechanosensitive channel